MTAKEPFLQTEANKRWEKKNKDHSNYLKTRASAKSFIRKKAALSDLEELEQLILQRKDRLQQLNAESYQQSIAKLNTLLKTNYSPLTTQEKFQLIDNINQEISTSQEIKEIVFGPDMLDDNAQLNPELEKIIKQSIEFQSDILDTLSDYP